MKRVIRFSRFFIPALIISAVILISGMYRLFTVGINFGIDFKPGLMQDIRIAETAFTLKYTGTSSVSIDTSAQGLDLIVSGLGSEKTTHHFGYVQYKTAGELTKALDAIPGIDASLKIPANTPVIDLFTSSSVSRSLSSNLTPVYIADTKQVHSIEDVRAALQSISDIAVKSIGAASDNSFQIRMGDDGSDPEMSKKTQAFIYSLLGERFGSDKVAVIKTDFVASQFSKTLVLQSIILVLATLALIWLYATIRFKWDFALGAVLGIIHDALIMVTVLAWTQMEFNSITIAAILTIVGYSINATVVVLDRIRENIRLVKTKNFVDIINLSQTESFSRTIITTLTTMLAVLALYIFTSGSMKDFAFALLVGMVSGAYSSIFISSAFIAFTRRKWVASEEEKKTQVKEFTEVLV
ncbi:MAG: protein translocase subunit SecF [Firmicutes bacterium]|jgi:preprotein translocase subunit SecF|nr:protein translocase subunit SecF [Bacillota bacterium]HPY52650.1 protein translocase subunit SecF [Treponemataceae bacterium]HQC26126.1 protein translocase subunit SecF [Treponemataceae bacterium]